MDEEPLNLTPLEQARVRMGNSLDALKRLTKRDLTLADLAQAVIEADVLLSALSFMYDSMYEASQRRELIGRRPTYSPSGGTEEPPR
jgi:hypothetical protein